MAQLSVEPAELQQQSSDTGAVAARPRSRFAWSVGEVSGALGDLGTFLPHILAAIAVVGMPPTGVLTCFGLFYLASGMIYGIPMGVQPMKAASAAVLIQGMTPGEVAGAGLVIGAFFALVGLTGIVGWLARITPTPVVSGIQLGLGLALAILGVRLIGHQILIGLVTCAVIGLTLGNRRVPAALVALIVAMLLALGLGEIRELPRLTLGLHLPTVILPTWGETLRGIEIAVLPQIPLTLTNAIIVTSSLVGQLFPGQPNRASVRTLSLTTGIGNLLAAPLGGYLMCHGAGGVAGHYRFGARTATAPVLIGLIFVVLGLALGDSAMTLLRLIPDAALGALLVFGGLELALAARVQRYAADGGELLIVMLIAIVAVASNAAIAFGIGMAAIFGLRRGWIRW